MKKRPILFSGPMVRAILQGRKTMTRRIVSFPKSIKNDAIANSDYIDCAYLGNNPEPGFYAWLHEYPEEGAEGIRCPYGVPGDRLWVRETYHIDPTPDESGVCPTIYRADCVGSPWDVFKRRGTNWTPSIHMPRWASRLTLAITGVRVERLQSISGEDAKAEGAFEQGKVGDDPVSPLWTMTGEGWRYDFAKQAFTVLWNSINGKSPGCTWADNPWVWVVEFERVN